MGPLGELGALFNPGMRHEIEERKSKANRREEEGNARDGDLRIDLASGVAVINLGKNDERVAAKAGQGAPQAPADGSQDPAEESVAGTVQDVPAAEVVDEVEADAVDEPGSAPSEAPRTTASDTQAATAGPQGSAPVSPARARRLAAAARRSADGDRPTRAVIQRPADAQLPSSKASRAAR